MEVASGYSCRCRGSIVRAPVASWPGQATRWRPAAALRYEPGSRLACKVALNFLGASRSLAGFAGRALVLAGMLGVLGS